MGGQIDITDLKFESNISDEISILVIIRKRNITALYSIPVPFIQKKGSTRKADTKPKVCSYKGWSSGYVPVEWSVLQVRLLHRLNALTEVFSGGIA